METRKYIAAAKKQCNSHNCAQAILHTYADVAGVDEQTAVNITGALGVGMGNMEGTCGAITGAGMVLGLASDDRVKAIRGMKQIMTKFQLRNGATQCKMLKGVETGMVLRDCSDCVADAADLAFDIILGQKGVQQIGDELHVAHVQIFIDDLRPHFRLDISVDGKSQVGP